jgi:N-acetylmuramoyl-L-alanine amidase
MQGMKLLVNGAPLAEQQGVVDHEGVYYASLRDISDVLGGRFVWQGRENQAIVRWSNNLLVVPVARSMVILNGERVPMSSPSRVIEGRVCIPLAPFADALSGSLTSVEGGLELLLPTGQLTDMRLTGESVHFGWTALGEVDAVLRGTELCLILKDITWPGSLRRIEIKRRPNGSLSVVVEARGRHILYSAREQGLRVEWRKPAGELSGATIAIDAGHGGSDPGAISPGGVQEKDITRGIADRLIPHLTAVDATVVDLRPSDTDVPTEARVSLARDAGAQLLVSIHLNGHAGVSPKGAETFFLPANERGAHLAMAVQSEVSKSLKLQDRGVKEASFHLLRSLPEIPAILIELGFPMEEQAPYLSDVQTQSRIAEAIFTGLMRFAEAYKAYLVG